MFDKSKNSTHQASSMERPKLLTLGSVFMLSVFLIIKKESFLLINIFSQSCPQKNCRRKVNDEKICSGCARYVKEPDVSMFLKLKLEDLQEGHILQQATMFSAVAEHFLGFTAKALSLKSNEERDEALEPHLGRKISFKVTVKVGFIHKIFIIFT